MKISTNKEVKAKLLELYDEVFAHNGYGEIKVNMRILARGQKEVIIQCGKEYRFVVNYTRAQVKELKMQKAKLKIDIDKKEVMPMKQKNLSARG